MAAMVSAFKERRDFLADRLQKIAGVHLSVPEVFFWKT